MINRTSRFLSKSASPNFQRKRIQPMTSFHSPAEREKDDISQANVHVRNILRNNREWVKDQVKLDPDCFKKLGKGCQRQYS
jgi:hypothetical protein